MPLLNVTPRFTRGVYYLNTPLALPIGMLMRNESLSPFRRFLEIDYRRGLSYLNMQT